MYRSEFNPVSAAARHGTPALDRARLSPINAALLTLTQALLTRMLDSLGKPPLQFVLWNGLHIPQHAPPLLEPRPMQVCIRDAGALLRLVTQPQLQFGELYTAQRIDVRGDLAEFLELIYRAQSTTRRNGDRPWLPRSPLAMLRNSLRRARRNIRHHYDFGNEFYKLWLDQRMVYTCAYFPDPNISLEAAQLAKMDLVCRKLDLKPGEWVIEAGSGWGALALHMAKHYGVSVKAYNISREQTAVARQRARDEGLEGRVEFIEDDYRKACGRFDAFVAVGMLEHVGVER